MSKITKIEIAKRNKDRVNIFIDEEFAFGCFGELVYKYGLTKDKEVNIDELKEIINDEEFLKCKSSALRIIEKSYKSQKEISDKLLMKEFSSKSIEKTLEFLKEYNFIDDKKYTNMYIKDKIKLQGKNKIKYSLLRKGISEDLIYENLNIIDEESQLEVAEKLAYKKYSILLKSENDKYKLSNKLIRFLITKGYDYDISMKVTKKVMELDYTN